MLDEREPWLECRRHFAVLYVVAEPGFRTVTQGLMTVAPRTPLSGLWFDLIVVPVQVQKDHKEWVDGLAARLKPRGKLVIQTDM